MADFKLDNDGDLDDSDGEWKLTDGADSVRQHWQIRNKFFLGEYFLDSRLGIAYFQTILVKGVAFNVVRTIFRRVLQDTPGVATVEIFDLVIDGATRRLTITAEGKLEPGVTNGDPSFRFEYDEFIIPEQFIAQERDVQAI